jgi:hypothetical protein
MLFFLLWVAFNPPSLLDSASARVFFLIQLSRSRVVVAVVAEFGCSSYAQFGKEVLRVQKQKLNSVVVYSLDPLCVCFAD